MKADPYDLVGVALGDRFEVELLLADRGRAAVYRARDLDGGGPVALKVGGGQQVGRIELAARALRALAHPVTVRLVDEGRHKGLAWVALEYVPGVPITSILRSGETSSTRVVRLLQQVAGALAELHGAGLVHGDVSPPHLLLALDEAGRDRVRLVGFGSLRRAGARLSEETATPLYQSPEQAAGELVDARSDTYALGCVAYELLSGQLPFPGLDPGGWATADDALRAHREQAPEPLRAVSPDVDPGLAAVVMGLLSKDPDDRMSSVELMEALAGWLRGAESARPPDAQRTTLAQLPGVDAGPPPDEDPRDTLRSPRATLMGAPRPTAEVDQAGPTRDLESEGRPEVTVSRTADDEKRTALDVRPIARMARLPSVMVEGLPVVTTPAADASAPAEAARRAPPTAARPRKPQRVGDENDVPTVHGILPPRRSRRPLVYTALVVMAAGLVWWMATGESEPPPPPTVDYVIESVPPGAEVFLDAERLGTTPLTHAWPAERSLVVTLKLDGHGPRVVRFAPGGRPSRIVALAPEARDHLRVESTPAGAEVRLDGRVLGRTPFEWRPTVAPEPLELEFRHPGHATLLLPVTPEASDRVRVLRVPLVPLARPVRE